MWTYEQAYGFTQLRLLVSVCELWLGLVFVLVLVAGVRLRGGWVPAAAVGLAVAALLGLAIGNPDRFIADQNVDRFNRTGRIDVSYLAGLSLDAVPALERLPDPYRSCALAPIRNRSQHLGPDTWVQVNLDRIRARDLLQARPPQVDDCGDTGLRSHLD